MSKQLWKPSSILSPLPAVLVTCRDLEGNDNLLTIGWVGVINSTPDMVSISIRKERFSHHMILESGEFVINLTTEAMVKAVDYCGVRSGRDEDKFAAMSLHKEEGETVKAPHLSESPAAIECKVEQVIELGSHDMFIGRVTGVLVDERFIDEKGRWMPEKAGLLCYTHGAYFGLGKQLGTMGYSVRKRPAAKKPSKSTKKETKA